MYYIGVIFLRRTGTFRGVGLMLLDFDGEDFVASGLKASRMGMR